MYRHRIEYRVTHPKNDYVTQRRVNSEADSAWGDIARNVDESDAFKAIDNGSRADIAAASRLGFKAERSGDNVYIYVENVTYDGKDTATTLRSLLQRMDVGARKTHGRFDILRNLYGYIVTRDGHPLNTRTMSLDETVETIMNFGSAP